MRCPHHPRCPGCPLLDLSYPEQLEEKRARLAHAFALYPHLPEVPAVTGSAWTEAYRHRLKLPVAVEGEQVHIGLYDRKGRTVLDTPDCPVLHPTLREALPALKAWMRGTTGIHSVDLRVSSLDGALQLVLATAGGDLPRGIRALPGKIPGLRSVAVSRADREGKKVMGQGARVVAGAPAIAEGIGPTRYQLHPGAFFQVDPRQAALLHEVVRRMVGRAGRVLDLYAGVGAYGLALAPSCRQVTLVEELPQAVAAARAVAPPNVEVIEGRAEAVELRGSFDVVLLNPARRGAEPELLRRIAGLAPRLVYVSCGPETLARDLDVLAAHGQRVKAVQPVDLFPQTAEVETVVLLEKGPALRDWKVKGGRAVSPWLGGPSGAKGRPTRILVLCIGQVEAGTVAGARVRPIGMVASHSLLRIELEGAMVPVLATLARQGHPVAGRDPRTRRFFAEKAGLVRPFVHVEVAGGAKAPLHGDLAQVLLDLGADDGVLTRAGLLHSTQTSPP